MGNALVADPEDLSVNSQILCEAHQGNACLQTQGSHGRRGVETGDSLGTLRTGRLMFSDTKERPCLNQRGR